ncbi:unnamed protein product, partial [Brassica oleracea var. botrytis]
LCLTYLLLAEANIRSLPSSHDHPPETLELVVESLHKSGMDNTPSEEVIALAVTSHMQHIPQRINQLQEGISVRPITSQKYQQRWLGKSRFEWHSHQYTARH